MGKPQLRRWMPRSDEPIESGRMAEVASILYPQQEIRHRVAELGRSLTEDYMGTEPVLISILKGGTVFLADLFRAVDLPLRVEFMSISSYGSPSGSGVVRILKDLDRDIGNEHVIVVEDIVDTGLTLSYLLATLGARDPRSLEVCSLLDKSVRRIAPLRVRYRGFDCPDRFVVGYGLDYEEHYRNIPDILAVEDQEALSADPDRLLPFLQDPASQVPPPPSG